MSKHIEILRIANMYLWEKSKWEKKVSPFLLTILSPKTALYKAANKVLIYTKEKGFSPVLYVQSRFFYLNQWAVGKFHVKSLPLTLLLTPKAEELYWKYKRLHFETPSTIQGFLRIEKKKGDYIIEKLGLQPPNYLSCGFLSPFFLGSSRKFLAFCGTQSKEFWENLPKETIWVWKTLIKFPYLIHKRT